MLCRADSVGVFQVESRAQMATLPRLQPRTFYDLVVEVALIRPGPIQGGSVHPYIRRRNGQEPVTYLHPLLENSLEQDARRAAVPGAADADGDRRRRLHARRRPTSCARRWARSAAASAWSGCGSGSTRAWPSGASPARSADEIFDKMAAFANFGFPESHSVSFAYLVYASSWIKLHEPAAFCAALLNAQPMGFYSPHSLVQDARRHGVVVRTPDLNARRWRRRRSSRARSRTGGVAVRLGHRVGASTSATDLAKAHRRRDGRTRAWRTWSAVPALTLPELEALATAGAFGCFGAGRRAREALWAAGAVAQSRPDRLAGRGHRRRRAARCPA